MLSNQLFRSSRIAAQTLRMSVASVKTLQPISLSSNSSTISPLSSKSSTISPLRLLSTTPAQRMIGQKDDVTVTFHWSEEVTVTAREGDNLLDIIINNDLDIDGFGACEGTLACSTCHVIFSDEDFAKLPDEATDEEMDMLDLAYGLEETSRLGCQVCMTKELSGITVKVPAGINDQR